ncbi:MAG: hypothetical protein ACO39U_05405 [Bacteroidia bacterium]
MNLLLVIRRNFLSIQSLVWIVFWMYFQIPSVFGQVQNPGHLRYAPNSGLTLAYGDSAYRFEIGGFVQPGFGWSKEAGITQTFWNSRRSFLMLSGRSIQDRLGFSIQVDFSQPSPLMDALVYWEPWNRWRISVGQKQTLANNLEMLLREDGLSMTDRSLLSSRFSKTGREFGLFIQTRTGSLKPWNWSVTVTSGDGRNSFGVDSRDNDWGGVKIGGRAEWLVLGDFGDGPVKTLADRWGENTPKVMLGMHGSSNQGASDPVGEGHGLFRLYDKGGQLELPDYQRWGIDVLTRYKGWALLMEYLQSTVQVPSTIYADPGAQVTLNPGQIANYLALGSAWNTHLSYYRQGWSLDGRWTRLVQEFEQPGSLLLDQQESALGISRYWRNGTMRLQAFYGRRISETVLSHHVEILAQVKF